MNITVNPDLTVHVERGDQFFRLAFNPRTGEPFRSEQEARQSAEETAALNPWMPLSMLGPPEPTFLKEVSPVAFLLMFTPEERREIRRLRKRADTDGDPMQGAAEIVDDWMKLVEDPRMTVVNLGLPQAQQGIDFLVTINILTAERAAQIKQGIPQ